MFPAELQTLCKKLHDQISKSEEDKYDLEVKLATQEAEVYATAKRRVHPPQIPFAHPSAATEPFILI